MRPTMKQLVGLMALAVMPSLTMAQGGPPPANVRLGEVRLEQLAQRRAVTGEIVARRRATLAGQQPGLVVELKVEAGDRVKAGDVIARLDDEIAARQVDRAQAVVASAEAVVRRREAEVTEAESDLARVMELDREGTSNQGEIDGAQTRVAVVKAQLLEARAEVLSEQAELQAERKRLDDMHIDAPFSGSVVAKRTEVGEWLGLGDPVIELVADDRLEAHIDVPESMIGRLQSATDVEITIRAVGATVRGKVLGVVPVADAISRMFRVRIEVPARIAQPKGPGGTQDLEDLVIRPGMSVTAMVPTSEVRDTLTIPKDAIKRGVTGEFVYYDAGGVSGVAPIVQLFAIGDRVAVRSEVLANGVRVVVQGNERMSPGQPLNELPDHQGAAPIAESDDEITPGEITPDQGG
ncbi:MAG: membrane fusion protein (multidrug efflux system) [Phycisphaerales bacterium]|jgi:membrane fusion protein (multidrug efflux system)